MNKNYSYWNPCISSKARRRVGIGLLIFSLLLLGFIIAISVYSVYIVITEGRPVQMIAAIVMFILAFGIVQLLYFYLVYVLENRKYQMNEEGISVLYGGRIQKFYPWVAFSKIVICDFDHATKFPSNCFLIIRLSSVEEPYGPHSKKQKYRLSGVETWRGYHYAMRNFTNILFFEYSPALLDKMAQLSKLPVMCSLTEYGRAKMESYSIDSKLKE